MRKHRLADMAAKPPPRFVLDSDSSSSADISRHLGGKTPRSYLRRVARRGNGGNAVTTTSETALIYRPPLPGIEPEVAASSSRGIIANISRASHDPPNPAASMKYSPPQPKIRPPTLSSPPIPQDSLREPDPAFTKAGTHAPVHPIGWDNRNPWDAPPRHRTNPNLPRPGGALAFPMAPARACPCSGDRTHRPTPPHRSPWNFLSNVMARRHSTPPPSSPPLPPRGDFEEPHTWSDQTCL